MAVLLHISDLHFGRPHRDRAREAVLRAFDALRPTAVIVSGDIVQWAESERAWRQARDFLEAFDVPVVTTPGNHDIARVDVIDRLWRPMARYHQYVHPYRDHRLELDGVVVVSLATPRRWTFELGWIAPEQLDYAETVFARAPRGAVRAVVMHHGLRQVGPFPRANAVRGHRIAAERFAEMGAEIVMTGHNHFPHVERLGGNGVVWSQAGTASSRRFAWLHRRTNSMSVVRADAENLSVQWWYLEGDQFEPGETHGFSRMGQ